MEGRLLTDEEQNTLANGIDETQFETSVQYWEAILEVMTKAQRDLTLKAVGEWIKSHDGLVLNKYIEILLRGEMPDETNK